jgi:hypothetical protein
VGWGRGEGIISCGGLLGLVVGGEGEAGWGAQRGGKREREARSLLHGVFTVEAGGALGVLRECVVGGGGGEGLV